MSATGQESVLALNRFLENKVALVTGAAWGIGRSIANHLVNAGAKAVLIDVDEKGLRSCQEAIDPSGENTLAVPTDLRKESEVQAAFSNAMTRFGRLDALVNNAGIYPTQRVIDTSLEDWNRVLDVNLTGTFLCAREAARIMIDQGEGGRIINTASAAGKRGRPGKAAYSTSKAGVIILTKVLALELADHDILVNAVSPGLVETEIKQRTLATNDLERELHEEKLKRLLLRRPCKPEDVARSVLFLLSPDSSYITGHVLHVDGGGMAGEVLRPISPSTAKGGKRV